MLKRLLFLMLFCRFVAPAEAQTQEQEATLKAVFIYNFTRYIEWDSTSAENDFVIAVIGQSPVTKSLVEITKNNKVGARKIEVKVFNNPDDIGHCDILFIPQKLPYALHSVLDKVGKGVLTVSEESGYAKQGTEFNFIIINDKLKFEANLKAIYQAGLKAGSQLLKLAIIVD